MELELGTCRHCGQSIYLIAGHWFHHAFPTGVAECADGETMAEPE